MSNRNSSLPILALGLTAALAVLAACGGGGEAGSAAGGADLANGEKVYKQTCATCHGQDANGLPNLGKGLRDNAFVRDTNDARMIEFIKVGRKASDPMNTTGIDMPPKGGNPAMTEKDMADVTAYLRTL